MKNTFFYLIIMVIFVSFLTSCAPSQTQTILATGTPLPEISTQTSTLAATVAQTPTVTQTPTLTPPPQPTFPLELTQTPGIYETATAYSLAVTQDYLNNQSLIGSMADLLSITQYFNPVGIPLASWHDIPIMSQATAGQEFKTDIYSYLAPVTLNKAAQFYNGLAASANCFTSTGTAGTGSNADHSVNIICLGKFNIVLTSFDNNPSQVIVVINKVP